MGSLKPVASQSWSEFRLDLRKHYTEGWERTIHLRDIGVHMQRIIVTAKAVDLGLVRRGRELRDLVWLAARRLDLFRLHGMRVGRRVRGGEGRKGERDENDEKDKRDEREGTSVGSWPP